MIEIEPVVQNFVDDYCRDVWTQLGNKGVDGVGVAGSYPRGDWSRGRPDLNFSVFVPEVTPDILIELGKIASSLNDTYSKYVNLRPELHPARFVTPWGRDKDKRDVFFRTAIFDKNKKDTETPFDRPDFRTEADATSLKMWYGKHYLDGFVVHTDNKTISSVVRRSFNDWFSHLKVTPLSYNLEEDIDLFFNESMIWGKLAVQQFAWIQGVKNKLDFKKKSDRQKIFDKIHNKEDLRTFIDVSGECAERVNMVLDARINYDSWKHNHQRAFDVYRASYFLMEQFITAAGKVK